MINLVNDNDRKKFNNKNKNNPIMAETEIVVYLLAVIVFIVINVGFEFLDVEAEVVKAYKWRLFRELFSWNIFYKIVIPLIYLSYRKDLRSSLTKYWSELKTNFFELL